MKIGLAIEDTGDLKIVNGDVTFVDEVDNIKQGIYSRLKIAKNEWFLNTELGLDRESALGKTSEAEVREAIIEAILQDPLIDSANVVDLRLNKPSRKLTAIVRCEVENVETIEMEVSI